MRLSMLPVSYFKLILDGSMEIETFFEQASQLQLNAVDLSILMLQNLVPDELEALRKNILDHGLQVLEVATYPDFTHPEEKERKRQQVKFASDLRIAAAVGAKMVRVTAGQSHPGLDRNIAISHAVDGISGAVGLAKELGLTLVFENHSKPGVWDYYDFDFPTANFLDILDNLPSEVKVQFDTANTVVYGDSPIDLLDRVIDRIALVHVADTHTQGHLEPALIGTGIVPFVPLFQKLKDAGYTGWLSVEEASFMGYEGMQKAVDFVRSTWESLS